jgi:gliding motility-associated protein GldM
MAGGKETPRQKMIGMMYLVLTALLALQVSNSVLEKFIFIDQTLQRQVGESGERNVASLGVIAKEVGEKGNREADVAALNKAQQVRKMTDELLTHLNDLRKTMADITGGYDENDQLIGAKDDMIVANHMIREGHGKTLKTKLNQYAAELSKLTGDTFAPLARDANEIDIAKDDPNQNMKDFTEYYFGNTPTAAGMATVSQLMTEVLNYEATALDDIKKLVGAKDIAFTTIVPLIRPHANVVAAGSKYEADLFITASAVGLDPVFRFNGTETKKATNEQGIVYGMIEFTAKAGNYDPKTNMAEMSYEAEIELNGEKYPFKQKYYVVKPVIQVRSAALSALYLNCGNELDVQVPALGTEYRPSFSSPQAKTIPGNRPGLVTVIPSARTKVTLNVSSGGNAIGSEVFDVKPVPLPKYSIQNRGKNVDMKNGEKIATMRAIQVKAEADENFAREVPKDARYSVRKVTVILARGSRGVQTIEATSENIDLGPLIAQAREGDRLVIEIKEVVRRTFEGSQERVQSRDEIFSIPLVQ